MGLHWRDAAARYAAAAHPVFDEARDAALKLAGVLIAATMGCSRHLIDLPAREAALEALAAAHEGHAGLSPSPGDAHFHGHLSRALRLLDAAFAAADAERAGRLDHDPFQALQLAWREMEAASRALPGFETIDFKQSCCAWHQARFSSSQGGSNGALLDLDS